MDWPAKELFWNIKAIQFPCHSYLLEIKYYIGRERHPICIVPDADIASVEVAKDPAAQGRESHSGRELSNSDKHTAAICETR